MAKPFNTKKVVDKTKTKRIQNALKMLELLRKNKRMKSGEIAECLGLRSTRMVSYLKDTLIILGYNIKSYGGYDGGYELEDVEILAHKIAPSSNEFNNAKTKRIQNSLKMLELLRKNKRMKILEIVQSLGLESNRMVYYLKDTLILLGHNIKSYGGPNGGYELIENQEFTNEEIEQIVSVLKKLVSKYSEIMESFGSEYSNILKKINKMNKEDNI